MSSVRSVTYGAGLDIEVANPAGLEPATNSLEGARSRNDFSARSDIFAFRASFEATAEFRFIGMRPSRLLAKPAAEVDVATDGRHDE